jgi:hypothetical protein
LDTLTLPDAVMGVTLRVESVTGNDGPQGDLFDRGFASAPMVEDAIIQLTDDQGDVVVESLNSEHPLLEVRTTWAGRGSRVGMNAQRGEIPRYARDDKRVARDDKRVARDDKGWKDKRGRIVHDERPALTLQLLPSPKVVTVDTQPRRDHDVPVRYMENNEWHDIIEAAGPDRVSGGQWSTEYSREYFRCVREDGMMVWLYHGSKQQTSDWFLHGWWD